VSHPVPRRLRSLLASLGLVAAAPAGPATAVAAGSAVTHDTGAPARDTLPGTWTLEPTPNANGSESSDALTSVACPNSQACLALGNDVEAYDGTS